MSKVILSGYILVADSDLAAVRQALPQHQSLTRAEDGCLVFNVTASHTSPNRFDVYEEFIDQSAFEYHQARVQASAWGRITSNVSRHYQITVEQELSER